MKKVICFGLSFVLVLTCSLVAFAEVELLPSGVTSWSDVGEDGLALANTYLKMLKSESGKEFFKNATDIPISWLKLMSDGSWCLSPVDDYYYFLKDGVLQIGDNSGHGGGGGRSRDVSSPEDFHIPTGTFNDYVDKTDTQYSPKNAAGKMSFWTDVMWHNKYDSRTSSLQHGYHEWSFYSVRNGFSAVGGGNEIYLIPFYNDGEKTMYSRYQMHFTVEVIENWYTDRDEIESYSYNLKGEYWDNIEGSQDKASSAISLEAFPVGNFRLVPIYYTGSTTVNTVVHFYESFSDYVNYKKYSHKFTESSSARQYTSFSPTLAELFTFYEPDTLLTFDGSNLCKTFQVSCENPDPLKDLGYVCSTTPIKTLYNIDTQKIPDNYYITLGGDTVYDYHITNPETGQSDTINNYVTNNYTYVTNNESGGGSGGGVGGNVNVTGNIGVNGNVGVDVTVSVPDVNININQNTTSGNGGDNVGDYIDTSGDVDVGGVIGKLPELSKGFSDYLRGFFSWLPAELYGLILLILVISVWNVFRSRR